MKKHHILLIFGGIILVSLALAIFNFYFIDAKKPALGINCPSGIAGQMDLCPSTRIPHQGDVIQFTLNTRQSQSGVPVTIYIGGRPGADGYIANPQVLTTGSTNSGGTFDFSYTVPSGDAWNTMHYFRGEAQVSGTTLKSNQVGTTVIPKTTDANWILTPSTYCHMISGTCTPINNSYPVDKVYPLAATGEVILLEDGQYNHAEFDRSCHSQTGPMIWVIARNINGPVFNPNPVGSSDTIAFYKKACWTTLVGLKIMGDDRAGVHFVTSNPNGPYLDDQFLEVTIDGGWNYYNNTGTTAKWGFQSYGLQGFRYVGGEVKNVGDQSVGEHAFYMHNPDTDLQGNAIELRDVNSSNVGRTYVQIVNRVNDCSYASPCPPGSGNVQIEHAVIKNTGLEGGCTGGSSLTFGGRNDYNIVVSNTYVESGLDPGLSCKGTGEFVTWDGNNVPPENNGPTTVRNSYFIMAANQGNKPLSEIGTLDKFTLEKSTFISGKTYSFILKNSTNSICLDRDSNITGNPEKRVTVYGVDYPNYQAALDAIGDCGSSGGNPTVTISATDASASETPGDPGTFTVSRTGSTANSLSVKFSVSGTATNGIDYSTITSPVTIPSGASSATIQLSTIDDAAIESSETAILTLTSDSAYIIGSPSSGTVTIFDNDSPNLPSVTLSATDPNASETPGDPGTFTFSRTGSATSSLTVYYSITGTATDGTDYSNIGSSIIIPIGASSATLQISPIDDVTIESSETATLTLSSNSGYVIGSPNSGTVTITDNDSNGLPIVTLSATDGSASETPGDPGTFVFTRTGSTASGLVVYFTVSGTATNGVDYPQATSPFLIPAGSASLTIDGDPIDDTIAESPETVTLTLLADSKYNIGSPSSGTATIYDNDSGGNGGNTDVQPPTVQIYSPANLATVSGLVTINANASDDTSVSGVQFKLDGVDIWVEDLTAPYSVDWPTDQSVKGTHSISAVAHDPSGNAGISSITVSVDNTLTNNLPVENPAIASPTLSIEPFSSSQLKLTWVNHATNQSGFRLESSTDGGVTYKEIKILPATYYYLYVNNLTPATIYYFRIKAYNTSGDSVYSNIVNLKTNQIGSEFTASLYKGVKSAQVATMQECLSKDSSIYPQGIVSGFFDSLTEAAVQNFQKQNLIAYPGIAGYGYVGPKTRAKLNEKCSGIK